MATQDDRIRLLRALAEEPATPKGLGQIEKALSAKQNRVVAAAATTAGVWKSPSLEAALIDAFDRFMANGADTDPGCVAKCAIIVALHAMECGDFPRFLRAAYYVQREPVFGGSEDTAPELRVRAAQALAELGYPDADFVLVDLLNDREAGARRGAVQLVGARGGRQGMLLLRMCVYNETAEPDIVADCFDALMKIDAAESLDFVAGFLSDARIEIAEGAALALGESRHPEALPHLESTWKSAYLDTMRMALILPLAVHRSDASFAFLLDVIRDQRPELAARAIQALSIFRGDEARIARIRDGASQRSEKVVRSALSALDE